MLSDDFMEIVKSFAEHQVVPDVVAYAPKEALSVVYPSGVEVCFFDVKKFFK